MLNIRMVTRLSILLSILLLATVIVAQADQAIAAENDGKGPIAVPGVQLVTGTSVDQQLVSSLGTSEVVPVIIVLKNQPTGNISRQVRSEYMSRIREKTGEVRRILAKYAGKRDFSSSEEMRAQARFEAESVSAGDKELKKRINQEADELLGQMRKETAMRVREAVEGEQSDVAAAVSLYGGSVSYALTVQNAVAALVPGTAIVELANHPLVAYIAADTVDDALLNMSGPTLFVDTFWNAGVDGGVYDGAICDTGVDTSHPALDDDTVGSRTWYSDVFHATAQTQPIYNDNPSSTDDLQGHGSHVAGIMLSSNSTYRGVAFGADIGMNLKAGFLNTSGGGSSYASDVRAALDWSIGQFQEPEVVNYSFGGDTTLDDTEHAQFFDAFTEANNCTTTIAAGNEGSGTTTITSPGIAYNCICVANMDDQDTADRADDTIRASSSRGPTVNGRKKPDITAPGTHMWSCNRSWETSGDFIEKSGTSMAAPQVAGATLLLNDAGVIDPREVKALLINTADDWGDPDWDATYGWGYMNLDRAYLQRNNTFLASVAPNGQSGWYKLYKTTGMDAGETATMTWYRHVLYNGSSVPTTVYSLNDLNLRLYDETNGAYIDADTGTIDNVHQVKSDRSGTQVIRAYAWSLSFSHGSDETFALATQEGTTEVSAPTVTPTASNYTPPLYSKFTVSVRVQNTGEVGAHSCSVTLTLPSGVILSEGSLTQSLGSIAAGSSAYAYYELDTTSSGVKTVNISTSSSSYGLSFSGSGSFTVTPGAQDVVDPYTTMLIGQPTYQTGGTDTIANGDFESGLAGWATSGTVSIDSTKPHGGSGSMKLGSGSGSAYQTVSIDSSAYNTTLTFWYKSSAFILARAGCKITDSSGNVLVYPFSSSSTTSVWNKVTIDLYRFRGQTIRVNFYSSGGLFGDSTLWVDDVTLKEGETVYVDDISELSLAARDDNSGIDYSQYRIGSDAYSTYTSPFTLAGRDEGYNSLYYRSVDKGGNYESSNYRSLYLDSQPPVTALKLGTPHSIVGGTQRATNGGFESGLTGWTTSGAATTTTTVSHSGSRSAKIGATGEGSIYQDIPVSSSASRAVLSAWYKSVQGAGSTYVVAYVIDPDTGSSLYAAGWNYTADWKQITFDVTAFKGRSVRIKFGVYTSSGDSATVYVDDVSLVENATAFITSSTTLTLYAAEVSGVDTYQYNVDSSGWVDDRTFTITPAATHSVAFRALDNMGHQESDVTTQLVVDSAGPTGSITINGGEEYTTSQNVTLSLSAADPAGVSMMRIQSDAGVWGSWESFASSKSYTLATSGEGTKTIGVQYQDVFGNDGAVYTDTIDYLIPTVMNIPQAKQLPDGEAVRLEHKIVTAIFPASGYFYVEEPDRRSGIRVQSTVMPSAVGIDITIDGVTNTRYAERVIEATDQVENGTLPELAPVGMPNGALGGGTLGYQSGVPGASGLNNVGLLVRTTGRVVRHFAGRFYIADGSSLVDSWSSQPCVLVDTQNLGGWVPPLDSYVSITGISGMSTLSGNPIRLLRPRSVDDVQVNEFAVAFVYDSDLSSAKSFRDLLTSDGAKTDLISLSDVDTADLSGYASIVIGFDTGGWGDAAKVNAILSAGKPIVALGSGGSYFLDEVPDLYTGWLHCWIGSENGGEVAGDGIFTYPHDLGVSPGSVLTLYSSLVSALGLYDPNNVVTHYLREISDGSHYNVVSENGYYFWGFGASPDAMTQAGKNLFVNLVYRTIMP